jgi:hypothetical protein
LLFASSVAGRIVTPPVEIAPPGLETALLEPGAVSSGSVDDVTTYSCRTTPARW